MQEMTLSILSDKHFNITFDNPESKILSVITMWKGYLSDLLHDNDWKPPWQWRINNNAGILWRELQ